MSKVNTSPLKPARLNFDNRKGIVKVTLRPIGTANYARFAAEQANPLPQLMEDLERQAEIYQRLQLVMYDLYEYPSLSVEKVLLKYFPDSRVTTRSHRSYGKLWQNEYITITEEGK